MVSKNENLYFVFIIQTWKNVSPLNLFQEKMTFIHVEVNILCIYTIIISLFSQWNCVRNEFLFLANSRCAFFPSFSHLSISLSPSFLRNCAFRFCACVYVMSRQTERSLAIDRSIKKEKKFFLQNDIEKSMREGERRIIFFFLTNAREKMYICDQSPSTHIDPIYIISVIIKFSSNFLIYFFPFFLGQNQ